MTIGSLKELEKLIRLCRKTGVDSITLDGITLKLGDLPIHIPKKHTPRSNITAADIAFSPVNEQIELIDTPDHLEGDALLYYSSGAQ